MTMPTVSTEKRPRIVALDILRGLAILGIFYINFPSMGGSQSGPVVSGWGNQVTEWILNLFVEGTQRGILQLLFGAGMILLTAKAMQPDGPVHVIDSYFRRNLWLLVFGLVHLFILLWPYDILHVYALAALFLWPFRKMGPKSALLLGLTYCIVILIGGLAVPTGEESFPGYDPKALEIDVWIVAEAFATMLIGVALFKWGILQGARSGRFYLALTLTAYLVGLPLRLVAMQGPFNDVFALDMSELARLATTIGHVGLVNLLLKIPIGEHLLRPFKAAGRTAFTLYLLQTIFGVWIVFPLWGFGLQDRLGSAGLAALASIVIVIQLVLANVWLRFFSIGPFEWLWRSLAAGPRKPSL